MRRGYSYFTAAAAFFASVAVAATPPTLRSIQAFSNGVLPAAIGRYAHDLAWSSEGGLLIATEKGVYAVTIAGGTPKQIIDGVPVPDGLPEPQALSSDGKAVAVVSWASHGGYTLRIADRKRLVAQRSVHLIPVDVAVLRNRSCVLGWAPSPPLENEKDVAVWCGSSTDSWTELKPLHRLHSDHSRELFRAAPGAVGGAMAMEPDGTIDVITSTEPGLSRYTTDGKLIEVLGQTDDQLVIASMKEILDRFASDLENRYRLLLNAQPIIDDLVVTPNGPAIVVRIADGDKIHWELWYPLRSGGVGDRIRLGIERIGPYGHLRCDAHGSDLACVGSQPPRSAASLAKTAQAWPHLWLFHLPPKSPKSLSASR